ncbi:MAG TPA: GAF domain-containing protein, partial [Leptospiraceae bacterium]|nr:GAF domain-containing protein [Leptospiraceae bacterium]
MPNQITKSEALRFISDITHAINQSDNAENVLERILSACIHATHAESGSIMLIDEDGENLTIHVSQGLAPESAHLKLRIGEGITGNVARTGKARIVGDATSESDYIPVKEGLIS